MPLGPMSLRGKKTLMLRLQGSILQKAKSDAGAPPPPPPASKPAVRAVDEPMSAEEACMDLPSFVNARVFGNPCFRPQQREVIEAVMAGRNAFVLMPTGGGASHPAQPSVEVKSARHCL